MIPVKNIVFYILILCIENPTKTKLDTFKDCFLNLQFSVFGPFEAQLELHPTTTINVKNMLTMAYFGGKGDIEYVCHW